MSSSQKLNLEIPYKKALLIVDTLHNIGDLFLLLQTVEGLREIYGVVKVSVWQWQLPDQLILDKLGKRNINVYYGKNFSSLFHFRTLVLMAGGQATRKNKSIPSLIFLITMFIFSSIFKCKFVAIGIGVGDITNQSLRKVWRFLFRFFSTIYVRDASSLARLKKLLVTNKKIKLTSDLAFYKSSQYDYIQNNQTQEHIIIAPCNDPTDGRYLNADAVVIIALAVSEKLNIRKFVLLAHDLRDDMDILLCESIANKISVETQMEVRVIKSFRINDYLDAYKSAALIMTNRLHSLIFGVISNKPVMVIEDGSDKLTPFSSKFLLPTILQGHAGLTNLNVASFKVVDKTKEIVKIESVAALSNFSFY